MKSLFFTLLDVLLNFIDLVILFLYLMLIRYKHTLVNFN